MPARPASASPGGMPQPHRALPTGAAREPSEREIGHIGNALSGQIVDESFVAALGYVVEVLDADNFRNCPRLGQLAGRNCAETIW